MKEYKEYKEIIIFGYDACNTFQTKFFCTEDQLEGLADAWCKSLGITIWNRIRWN